MYLMSQIFSAYLSGGEIKECQGAEGELRNAVMWLFGGGRLLVIWEGQRRKGGLPGWLYLNQASDLNLLAMSSDNEFCSVSVSCLMNYTGADFTPGKSCIWSEETWDKQREKGGGVI